MCLQLALRLISKQYVKKHFLAHHFIEEYISTYMFFIYMYICYFRHPLHELTTAALICLFTITEERLAHIG